MYVCETILAKGYVRIDKISGFTLKAQLYLWNSEGYYQTILLGCAAFRRDYCLTLGFEIDQEQNHDKDE